MHILFREQHGLEENEIPIDLDQKPSDLSFLSFSDSDLSGFAEGWKRGKKKSKTSYPSLRLANIDNLKHPLSIDTYIDKTLSKTKGILIRLIGGVPYWEYGLQEISNHANQNKIPLAVLPADGRVDERLDKISNLPISTLRRLSQLCEEGGPIACQAAIAQMGIAAGLYFEPTIGKKTIPKFGFWTPRKNIIETIKDLDKLKSPNILVVFYRSFLTANDLNPIKKIFYELEKYGFTLIGAFLPSLKEPESSKWLTENIKIIKPSSIINITSFSGKNSEGTSPLDTSEFPVFQISLATSKKSIWSKEFRGLSPTDMSMHVTLPEIDGRIFLGVASFKEKLKKNLDLEFSQTKHVSFTEGINAISKKVNAWVKLQKKPISKKKLGFILSTYPGKNWQIGHAIGLDTLKSIETIIKDLKIVSDNSKINYIENIKKNKILWSLDDYLEALSNIPKSLKEELFKIWGNPTQDSNFSNNNFHFKCFYIGNSIIATQPERGKRENRLNDYHDDSLVPCHSYVAFYLWLKHVFNCEAVIHLGAHGTLEWLPGKSIALSQKCWPEVLINDMPVIYPFIINDPGEAVQAKRRINAVTIGHIPPPLIKSGQVKKFEFIETLLDEYSNADVLDPKRRERLKFDILDEAKSIGLKKILGISNDLSDNKFLSMIDRFVCDIKDTQFGKGLHIFGKPQTKDQIFETNSSAISEKTNLIRSLKGKSIPPGPSGSPFRGRLDILPSGRNLFSCDPLSVPSRTSYAQGKKIADEFVKKYLQDNGEWPKDIVLDLWASSTMRTAGEEFSMALDLLGAKPIWKDTTERVSGFEIIPIALLDRPRVDVTLRVSGLFRDIFPTLTTLYNQIIESLAKREECEEWNPYIKSKNTSRVFGPKPGTYGLNNDFDIYNSAEDKNTNIAESWIESSSWTINGNKVQYGKDLIKNLLIKSKGFVHFQDLKESDILLNSDHAKHYGGFNKAKTSLGGNVKLYHLDITNAESPRARALSEELSKVIYARASNPKWIYGMKNHGYRGGSELSETLDNMILFLKLTNSLDSQHFDMYFEATLGNREIFEFLKRDNIDALNSMIEKFKYLYENNIWKTKSNSIISSLTSLNDRY